jgi:hypothetical protein
MIVTCASALQGFEWDPHPANATTLHHCVGDDVMLAWNFTTLPNETVGTVVWKSKLYTPIATRVSNFFFPTFPDSVKADFSSVAYASEAAVTLHNVTSSAAGNYAVHVDLSGGVQDPDIRTVDLVVSGRSPHYVV